MEAAGVGLWGRVESKQVIHSKGPLETQETANTRFSSTLQVHGIWQSSRVLLALPIRVRTRLREEQYRGCSSMEPGNWSTSELPTANCTFLSPAAFVGSYLEVGLNPQLKLAEFRMPEELHNAGLWPNRRHVYSLFIRFCGKLTYLSAGKNVRRRFIHRELHKLRCCATIRSFRSAC